MPPEITYYLRTLIDGQRKHDDELRQVKRLLSGLRTDVGMLLVWAKRCGLLAGIWMGAVWVNLTAEDKAAMLSALARALTGS